MTVQNNKSKDESGWKKVSKFYAAKDFLKDSLIPAVISGLITVWVLTGFSDTFEILNNILNLSLEILPVILSLLIASYAIVLTIYWSDYGKKIRKIEVGKKLLSNLNSGFAAILMIMILGLLVCIVVQVVIWADLNTNSYLVAQAVNSIALFFILFILCFSVYSLKDIIANIFNLGETMTHFDD